MMTIFARTRRLSLGFRYRCLLAFAVLLPALLSGVAAPQVHAQLPWDEGGSGGVQVSLTQLMSVPALPTPATTLNLDIRVGETKSYYLRLTEAPNAPSNAPGDRWWVMVNVDGQKRQDNHDEHYMGLSWMPPLGREFHGNNWDDWVDIRITAHERDDEYGAKPGTSVLFKHEVWDHDAECPVHTKDAHWRRSGWVRVNILAKDATPGNPNPVDPNPGNTDPENTDPENTDPENTDPGNTDPGNTDPENTNPENINPENGNNGGNGGNNLVDGNTGSDGNGGIPGDGNGGTPGGPSGPGTGQPLQRSSDATLRDLVLSHGTTVVPLKPGFMPETETYTTTVETEVTQVTVTPTPTHPQAQVAYLDQNDRVLTDASDRDNGFQVDVAAGDTVIKVKVTAEDGRTMKTYTVTVTRPPSSDATLRDLVLSHGTNVVPLTPRFLPETKAYTATVDSAVTQLTVTPTPNHAGAHIMYLDGDDRMLTDANDGEDGFQVDVAPGDTMITVKVTAEDGTMETYTVTVTRLPSSDATLRDLVVSHGTNVVRLSPRFRPGTMMYRAEVDSTVTQVTVTPMPNHAGAQVMYLDGGDRMLTDANNTERGFQVELPVVGDNVINVKVTAEDGGTMKTYTVTVTRVVGLARNREGVGHEWLARFARTVGTQVVNVVGERFVAPRQPGLAGQVAGHDLSRLVRASVQPDDAPETRVRPGAGLAEGYTRGRSDSRLLTARDFLSGTSFTLTMGQEDGLSAALWGRGAIMRFDGRDGDLLLDGEVATGMLGVDYARGAVTGGLLVGLNRGEGDYQSPTGDGELDSLLVGVYPYARVEISERISAWGLFGHGRGNVTLTPDNQAPISTDIGLHMGALGVEGMLSDGSGPTGLDLTVKSDAMWVKIESDEAVGLDSTHAKVSRLRLMLEGVRVFEVAPGATLTPSGQIGLRHDEGDAETGFGLDMSAGIRYAAGRLTIEGTVRTLVAHEDSAYEEWGASGAIRMTPDALGRGLSLTLAPAWGNTASKAEQLWAGQAPTGLATTGSTLPGARLNAELGYGMVPTNHRGILTPYAGLSLGDGSSQSYRTGARWQMAPETTLALEASHAMAALSPAPVNSVMLHAAWRW